LVLFGKRTIQSQCLPLFGTGKVVAALVIVVAAQSVPFWFFSGKEQYNQCSPLFWTRQVVAALVIFVASQSVPFWFFSGKEQYNQCSPLFWMGKVQVNKPSVCLEPKIKQLTVKMGLVLFGLDGLKELRGLARVYIKDGVAKQWVLSLGQASLKSKTLLFKLRFILV
jgi:hypothetical protein